MTRLTNYIVENEITNIEAHLKERGLDPSKTQVIMDKKANIAIFMLYNLSGKLVGYQQYNPNGVKGINYSETTGLNLDKKEMMKYYTYLTKENEEKRIKQIGVYGLQTYDLRSPVLFVVEGIFDCIKLHNLGLPAIAVLANDPKPFGQWLRLLPQKIVVIMDNDENLSGNKLAKYGDKVVKVPSGFKDLGDMSNDEVRQFLKDNRLL